MAVTKITSIFPAPLSDLGKDIILDQINVPREAAEVIRDSNNNVTAVQVNLPDASAAATKQILENNPGVATNDQGGMIPNFIGWDGTQANLDALVAAGDCNVFLFSSPTTSDVGGNYKVETTATNSNVGFTMNCAGDVLPDPNDSDFKASIKFGSTGFDDQFARFNIVGSNGAKTYKVQIRNDGLVQLFFAPSATPLVSVVVTPSSAQFKDLVLKLRFDRVIVDYDGSEIINLIQSNTSTVLDATLNLNISSFSGSPEAFEINEFLWTHDV
jgi:hypothetical protein